jgi:hypothetical protein
MQKAQLLHHNRATVAAASAAVLQLLFVHYKALLAPLFTAGSTARASALCYCRLNQTPAAAAVDLTHFG